MIEDSVRAINDVRWFDEPCVRYAKRKPPHVLDHSKPLTKTPYPPDLTNSRTARHVNHSVTELPTQLVPFEENYQ